MKILFLCVVLILISGCSTPEAAKKPDWKTVSNQLALEYAKDIAVRYPESGSSLGLTEFDSQVTKLEDDMESKDRIFLLKWKSKLEELQKNTNDLELSIDYSVLLSQINLQLEGLKISDELKEIPYSFASKRIYKSLLSLINEQSPAARKTAAVTRFHNYIHGSQGFLPFITASINRSRYFLNKYDGEGFFPMKNEVEEYLSDSTAYQKGVRELLEKSARDDWKKDYENFLTQVKDSDDFLRKFIIPKARTDFHLPERLYSFYLLSRGIYSTPKELLKLARKDYTETYKQFRAVAYKVSREKKLKNFQPVNVIRFLKQGQVTHAKEVGSLYHEANYQLVRIIIDNSLVSLPSAPLRIRLAGDAESRSSPVPSLIPPPLINNVGQRPEFIVPTSSSGKMPFDDFSYPAAAIILTAHEGRPGHDLQFSTMLDNGISTIRARFAMNTVNVEGWGLYAEELVYPFLPAESQLVALQSRLWRMARAYLEPELQLGLIKETEVMRVFTNELGVSDEMAKLEVRRYTYEDPGQAPSYYYGFKVLRKIKENAKERLGKKFSEKCFNDAVLGLGLLPINIVAGRMSQLVCP